MSSVRARAARGGPSATAGLLVLLSLLAVHEKDAGAGVINPDISVIGQPLLRWHDDLEDPTHDRATFDAGEIEFIFDAALNPYARGTIVAALAEEGLELEEGYFSLLRGLPGGLALRGGQYRVGFGRLNTVHPHAYPFAERFRVLSTYLPGAESFGEVGVQVSKLLALGESTPLTLSLDVHQGDTFRREREATDAEMDPLLLDPENGDRQTEPRPGGTARASLFLPLGEPSALEIGASASFGTNNVAAHTRTSIYGLDARAKLWRGARSVLVLQGEIVRLDREDAGWDPETRSYTESAAEGTGGYVYADWNWGVRYNAGVSYERFQPPHRDGATDQALGLFAGLALMEETTAFRVGWERYVPGQTDGEAADPDAVHTLTLRVIYSMGPHKAHSF